MWFALSLAGPSIALASDPWWDANWLSREKLRFKNGDIATNLTNVPVLVVLNSTRVDYAKIQNAGQDIRFIDAGGSTPLSHEIEKWDETGNSYVWVKVPQINAMSTSDYMWMYFDNASAPDGQNATDVWSNGYSAVYHMANDPTPASIVFDNVTTNSLSGSRASATFSHTVGTGSNRALVVVVMTRGDQGASAVSYGGNALTQAVSEDAGGSSAEWVSVWYMVAPPTGANNVVVTFGINEGPTAVAAMSYFGVDQTTPINATAGNSDTDGSSTVSVSITTTVDGAMVVGGLGHHGGDTAPHTPAGAVTAERFDFATGASTSNDSAHAGGEIATSAAGSYTFRWTSSTSDDHAIACVALTPLGTVVDSTASAFHGAPLGSMNSSDLVSGRIGNGIDFDGSDDMVITTMPSNTVNQCTLSAWFESDDIGNISDNDVAQRFLSLRRSSSGTRLALGLNDDDFVATYWHDGSGNTREGSTLLQANTWYHAALTYDGSTIRLYLNGAQQNSWAESSMTATSAHTLLIASSSASGSRHFDGGLDELRVSNAPRSADWIKVQYRSTTDTLIRWTQVVTAWREVEP